jgi:hypothetical protein
MGICTPQAKRIGEEQRSPANIGIRRVGAPREPYRITLNIPTNSRVIFSEAVVRESRLGIVVLPREAQVVDKRSITQAKYLTYSCL